MSGLKKPRPGARVPLTWNRDVVALSDAAQALVIRLTIDSAERLSDGQVPALVLAQQTVHLGKKANAVVEELVADGWADWAGTGGDLYLLRWRDFNLAKVEVEAIREKNMEIAAAGGQKRAESADRDDKGHFLPKEGVPAMGQPVLLDGDPPARLDQPSNGSSNGPAPSPVPVLVPVYEEEPFSEGGVQEGVEEPERFGFFTRPVRATR